MSLVYLFFMSIIFIIGITICSSKINTFYYSNIHCIKITNLCVIRTDSYNVKNYF